MFEEEVSKEDVPKEKDDIDEEVPDVLKLAIRAVVGCIMFAVLVVFTAFVELVTLVVRSMFIVCAFVMAGKNTQTNKTAKDTAVLYKTSLLFLRFLFCIKVFIEFI